VARGEDMKKILIGIYLFGGMMIAFVMPLSGDAAVINQLTRIEATAGKYASQIVFEFLHPLYYEKEVNNRGEQVTEEVILYFPGISLADFRALQVYEKIRSLGVVKDVAINFERLPVGRIAVKINFEKESVLLRLTKMEEPNILVLDIFDKKVLEALRKKVTTTLYACNNVVEPGATVQDCVVSCEVHPPKKKRMLQPRKAHIVIDAGHGGIDGGANSFGLQEKNFTLDIARRACASLKKEGYRAFLTRNADAYLSIGDRVQLARQLKADLFVSVHVNAVAGLHHVSGVESYFFDGTPYFDKRRCKRAFLFIGNKHDKCLAQVADRLLYERFSESKTLSGFIQESVLNCLKKKNIAIVNRGIKRANFGVLLRNEAPASLVEVGFLTNKAEAKRLTKAAYRNWLAHGICNGIKKFLHRQKDTQSVCMTYRNV